jgi:DNA-directed RNA polymerase specialized sigma24 family protein
MSAGYVIPVDPAELANRFAATEDPRYDRETGDFDEQTANISDEDVADFFSGNDYESQIAPLLDRIPDKEADLIYLYFIQRKRQLDIATIFGITQAAVSYRLERGIKRIQFLLSIPQITEDELKADLPEVFPASSSCPKCASTVVASCPVCEGKGTILIDVSILVGMWRTTCQSEVANTLGLTQGRVRHRFFKAVEILQAAAEKDEKFEPYFKVFSSISGGKKFNILREVRLPQWADRGADELG